jgi:putative acetyltransferase
MSNLLVRPELPADREGVLEVNRAAFGSDAEGRLVDALRAAGHVRLSLVAEELSEGVSPRFASQAAPMGDRPLPGRIVGHVLFSALEIVDPAGTLPALALGPMAVAPARQRSGIGTQLIRRGLDDCRAAGHRIAIVVGHPEYYPRFGFSADLARPLASPYAGDAWMALELTPGALAGVTGTVRYPAEWSAVG